MGNREPIASLPASAGGQSLRRYCIVRVPAMPEEREDLI